MALSITLLTVTHVVATQELSVKYVPAAAEVSTMQPLLSIESDVLQVISLVLLTALTMVSVLKNTTESNIQYK